MHGYKMPLIGLTSRNKKMPFKIVEKQSGRNLKLFTVINQIYCQLSKRSDYQDFDAEIEMDESGFSSSCKSLSFSFDPTLIAIELLSVKK